MHKYEKGLRVEVQVIVPKGPFKFGPERRVGRIWYLRPDGGYEIRLQNGDVHVQSESEIIPLVES